MRSHGHMPLTVHPDPQNILVTVFAKALGTLSLDLLFWFAAEFSVS